MSGWDFYAAGRRRAHQPAAASIISSKVELFLFVGRLAAERARCDPETDAYSNANREPDTYVVRCCPQANSNGRANGDPDANMTADFFLIGRCSQTTIVFGHDIHSLR
jgi:hypothetical protein